MQCAEGGGAVRKVLMKKYNELLLLHNTVLNSLNAAHARELLPQWIQCAGIQSAAVVFEIFLNSGAAVCMCVEFERTSLFVGNHFFYVL